MIDWLTSKIVYGALEGMRKWILAQLKKFQKMLWVVKKKTQIKDGVKLSKSKDRMDRLKGTKELEKVYSRDKSSD